MLGAGTLTFNPTVGAAVAAVIVGFAAFWSNPRRSINQAFFSASVHVAVWLWALQMAVTSDDGLFWVRVNSSIGAFFPMQLWLIKDCIVTGGSSLSGILRIRRWWLLSMFALGVVPFTGWFIPHDPSPGIAPRGAGYYLYIVALLSFYVVHGRETIRDMRARAGVSRLELQIVLLGGSSAAVVVLMLMAMRAMFGVPWLIRLQPLVILFFYTGMVIAITTYRMFDARQLILVILEKTSLIVAVAGAAFVVHTVCVYFFAEPIALLAATAVGLWLAQVLNKSLDRWFHFFPEATAARQAAFAVIRRETRIEELEKSFADILKGWGHTEHAVLMSGTRGLLRGAGVELPEESAVVRGLRQLRWATPERLARERPTPDRMVVGAFLTEHRLGALVIGEGPTLTALVGVGVAASRRPYTYPQITQLLELASIMESALERAHFSVKAQHAEQLATVGLLGASLAHEIRNPLVTIKTFVQLLPQHYQDQRFRDKFFALIGEEVSRIDRLTEQLLDLASPRAYKAEPLQLHPVLRTSLELVAAKATDKRIEFVMDFRAERDHAFTDASAAKQVVLNLCLNAIQAVEAHPNGERWVKVATRNVPRGVEMSVEDSGPGIAPEIRPRLFQPFQSTKSSGFGLGLAICSDILAGLDATISVDPSTPGRGALFRVVFPCPA
ncbi:MAG TPA: ATP-binding protein [Opitutus sp.]|nr:ATP-binding protein [Opitutus sp.]